MESLNNIEIELKNIIDGNYNNLKNINIENIFLNNNITFVENYSNIWNYFNLTLDKNMKILIILYFIQNFKKFVFQYSIESIIWESYKFFEKIDMNIPYINKLLALIIILLNVKNNNNYALEYFFNNNHNSKFILIVKELLYFIKFDEFFLLQQFKNKFNIKMSIEILMIIFKNIKNFNLNDSLKIIYKILKLVTLNIDQYNDIINFLINFDLFNNQNTYIITSKIYLNCIKFNQNIPKYVFNFFCERIFDENIFKILIRNYEFLMKLNLNINKFIENLNIIYKNLINNLNNENYELILSILNFFKKQNIEIINVQEIKNSIIFLENYLKSNYNYKNLRDELNNLYDICNFLFNPNEFIEYTPSDSYKDIFLTKYILNLQPKNNIYFLNSLYNILNTNNIDDSKIDIVFYFIKKIFKIILYYFDKNYFLEIFYILLKKISLNNNLIFEFFKFLKNMSKKFVITKDDELGFMNKSFILKDFEKILLEITFINDLKTIEYFGIFFANMTNIVFTNLKIDEIKNILNSYLRHLNLDINFLKHFLKGLLITKNLNVYLIILEILIDGKYLEYNLETDIRINYSLLKKIISNEKFNRIKQNKKIDEIFIKIFNIIIIIKDLDSNKFLNIFNKKLISNKSVKLFKILYQFFKHNEVLKYISFIDFLKIFNENINILINETNKVHNINFIFSMFYNLLKKNDFLKILINDQSAYSNICYFIYLGLNGGYEKINYNCYLVIIKIFSKKVINFTINNEYFLTYLFLYIINLIQNKIKVNSNNYSTVLSYIIYQFPDYFNEFIKIFSIQKEQISNDDLKYFISFQNKIKLIIDYLIGK